MANEMTLILLIRVEPQSYGSLMENSVNQTLTFNTYWVSTCIIKISTKWERVVNFSSVPHSFSFGICQFMLHSDHNCTFFMENVQNSIKYLRYANDFRVMSISDLQTPLFPRGFRNSEVLLNILNQSDKIEKQ